MDESYRRKGGNMDFRHEWKHEINRSDRLILRQRLSAVAKPDAHAVNGVYYIRSLYFDTWSDRALREKINGIENRDKFRIRYYNRDLTYIVLEKKCKRGDLGYKESCLIEAEEVQAILGGNYDWMKNSGRPLLNELCDRICHQGLKPKTIVDYTREAYVYAPGNVRVTMDYDIKTGLFGLDFLNPDCPMIPIQDQPAILEVKWDRFLPSIIRDAVSLRGRQTTAFSKYAACRMFD